MFCSFSRFALTVCSIAWLSVPLAAQDDHWTLLQDRQLRLSSLDLIANDVSDPEPPSFEPVIRVESRPSHGVLLESSHGDWIYVPDRRFFGIDGFTYSWDGPDGPVTGEVELLVTPWITPLAGPFGLLSSPEPGASDGVGYYNSHSGTFYFCPVEGASDSSLSAFQSLSCDTYRFPEFKAGWLPLIGSWRDADDRLLADRPGLYDPVARTVYLLDEDVSGSCKTCTEPIPALPLTVIDRFQLQDPDRSALIPVSADFSRDGADTVVFYRPAERRFVEVPGWTTLATTLADSMLWPLTVPDPDGFGEPAVFDLRNGQLDLLLQNTWVQLDSSSESLVIARREPSGLIYQVYDPWSHGLTAALRVSISGEEPCVISGTQILRFPNDPDPPPNGPASQPEIPGESGSSAGPCAD